ncbi:MAG TPA: hypothetical protein DCP89_00420 [Acidimicrobiaceae bacterium]|jgi:hypothetical protein|nr:hypothetical protein [Acidimicrobiaceae bacterium]
MGTEPKLKINWPALPSTVRVEAEKIATDLLNRTQDSELILESILSLGRSREKELADPVGDGAVYTPYPVAEKLVNHINLQAGQSVCDPAMGAGVFLIAAAEKRFHLGQSVESIAKQTAGADIDTVSVEVAKLSMQLWSWLRGTTVVSFDGLVCVDPLINPPTNWVKSFDVIIGNPPFLGQLKSRTTRHKNRAQKLKQRYGNLATQYVDESALFLLASLNMVRKKGTVCLIIPTSVFGAASARPIREHIDGVMPMKGLWVGGRDVFTAAKVDVLAPILSAERKTSVDIYFQKSEMPPTEVKRENNGSWGAILANALGVPTIDAAIEKDLQSEATITADFRDAYYWLSERVEEEGFQTDRKKIGKLATVGLVDPLTFNHGKKEVRFAKTKYSQPVVVTENNPPNNFSGWLQRRRVPKILVATQTKVIECVVDAVGDLIPSTPLIIIQPTNPNKIWHLAAALSSPVGAAWAASEAAGTGLGANTVRLRASQLNFFPLPARTSEWDRAADLAHSIQTEGGSGKAFRDFGLVINSAYGIEDDDLLEWWINRLP